MPKIVRFHSIGGPENLQVDELPSRQPGQDEVKLQVQAVGLNRAEALFIRGVYGGTPDLPSRIGYEAAGIVESVGPGVDPSWVGKKVATVPGFSMSKNGVLGEEAIVPAVSLGEYPAKLSPVEAASIWMQYLTAHGALVTFGGLKRGDFVLITAASSSVGLAAIQIVNAEGGIPIATTRKSNKSAELRALGAAHVIATEEEDLVKKVMEITGGKGARLIFDPVAGPGLEKLAEAAAFEGMIFEYGGLSMQPTPFPMIALGKGLTIRGYTLMEIRQNPALLKSAKQYVFDRLQDGRFQPKIAKTFPLAQSKEAYQYLESNQQVGKVVITT
ncbi:MAG TPA: zinc-dependent alcohol dehydrogenase family protein [Bryobacteraceae bacterium]|jgi:NADPH:quinone reductase-like Zn-dependent oxidoreductase|nr:zinc-dependent alcohol dehydrogenase family protein [Bryobacteraceae bacterium]